MPARVQARIADDRIVHGEGRGGDALAAMRLAFQALEGELQAEQEGARARAAQWLRAVKSRIAAASFS